MNFIHARAAFLAAATLLFFGFSLNAQPIISEYVEGSSFNKCIEIFNPGGTSIDLGGYGYRGYHNGATTPTYEFSFPAVSLAPGQVYVICHPSANIACSGAADLTDSRVQFNGDDAVTIYDTLSGNNVDIFGSIGQDPGSRWTGSPCGHTTIDHTLRRKAGVTTGVTGASTGFPTLCTEWDEYSNNDCSDLGNAPETVSLPECNPIISEYVEGTGNCKFLEIYNPCCDAIDLGDYEVLIHFNACTSVYTIPLSGLVAGDMLASGEVIVLYNPNETCTDYPALGGYPANFYADNRVQFNGDDAVVVSFAPLSSGVDIFGNICENTVWTDGTCGASTQNQSLVRHADVCAGITTDPTTGFPTLCSEWDTLGVDFWTGLGAHTSDCLEGCPVDGKRGVQAEAASGVVAFPNPFEHSTTIRFNVAEKGNAALTVFNLTGEQVAVLFNGQVEAGRNYEVQFDATHLPAGAYVYRLNNGSNMQVGKLMLVK